MTYIPETLMLVSAQVDSVSADLGIELVVSTPVVTQLSAEVVISEVTGLAVLVTELISGPTVSDFVGVTDHDEVKL